MAATIAVYCKRSVAEVKPVEIFAALQSADLWTPAASRYIPPYCVHDAMVNLKIESVGGKGFDEYALSYRPEPLPQCLIRRLPLAEGAKDSDLEDLRTVHHPGMDKIRRHVGQAKDVVFIELSSGAGEQITALLASEIARWIAEIGDGLIARSDQSWWELDDLGAYRRILP